MQTCLGVVGCIQYGRVGFSGQSKEEGKDKESIKSNITPDTGHHMEKWQKTQENVI